ncbi:MAG TPA: tetratricopeptide repeat protein [Candidatus Angelobacter sp.]|jgi:Tfp pilus assembly protein PilF/TolB-like protein|nr:tetratricopeptide repeat protein [Candidatus Angelobacter sp.]
MAILAIMAVMAIMAMPYNLCSLSRPASIFVLVLSLAVVHPLCAQNRASSVRASRILLIMPFENVSKVPGIDWIGEAFPEVLGNRLNSGSLFIISRDDRLYAFDRLGIPATAKPSRATVYQMAQQMDADYVIMGSYSFDGSSFTVHSQIMELDRLRLSPEMTESGPLTSLITIQTALAWDINYSFDSLLSISKNQFLAQFPPIRLDALENYIRGILAANVQEKIKFFKEAIRFEPNHTLAMLQLAKTYYKIRDYQPAMTWFSKIPPADSNFNEGQFFLGLSALYAGQLEKAETAFRLLAQRLPLTEIYNNLGVVSARRGEKRARGYFERTLQIDPNDPDYHYNLALALLREGDAAGATKQLRESLTLSPNPEVKSLLDGVTAGSMGKDHLPLERIKSNYDESSFRQLALEIENANEVRLQQADAPTQAAFHMQRGRQLLEEDLSSEAEKEFRKAIILDPASAEAHAGLARVFELAQDNIGARNEAHAALNLKPTADVYLLLARLDLAEKKTVAAAHDVDQALALDPSNASAVAMKRDIALAAGKRQPEP